MTFDLSIGEGDARLGAGPIRDYGVAQMMMIN